MVRLDGRGARGGQPAQRELPRAHQLEGDAAPKGARMRDECRGAHYKPEFAMPSLTEENPQGMYLHPFNMYHGTIDTRCGATNTAQERPRELSLFYIIDIDTDILGLTQHNIQQLKSVPEFYTLFTMIHFGVSFRVDKFSGELNIARLGDYLQCLPVRQLRCSYVKVYNAIEIENHIKSCMSQQMMFNIEGEPRPFHTRECIHGVDKNTIVTRVEKTR